MGKKGGLIICLVGFYFGLALLCLLQYLVEVMEDTDTEEKRKKKRTRKSEQVKNHFDWIQYLTNKSKAVI